MKALHEIRRDIVAVCRAIDRREYVGGRDGNISARTGSGTIVITPAALRKGDVEVDDLVVLAPDGRQIAGRRRASSETGMHLRIYELRPDVNAVVHAHPPVSTGFAAAGIELNECVLPEVIVGLGRVPITPYATPGTDELSRSLDSVVASHDAILLQNHGAVTVGEDVLLAHQRMETLEHSARILLVARLLGGANPLTVSQVGELLDARSRYGVRAGLAACDWAAPDASSGGRAGGTAGTSRGDDALVERIVKRVLDRLEEGPERA
ncbi:MAG: class II aldolase/adducin family protein [bacterium]